MKRTGNFGDRLRIWEKNNNMLLKDTKVNLKDIPKDIPIPFGPHDSAS